MLWDTAAAQHAPSRFLQLTSCCPVEGPHQDPAGCSSRACPVLLRRLASNSLLQDPAVCHSRLPKGPFCKNADLQQNQEGERAAAARWVQETICCGAEESVQPAAAQDVAGQNASSCADAAPTHTMVVLIYCSCCCCSKWRPESVGNAAAVGLCLSQNDPDRCLTPIVRGCPCVD